MISTIGRLVPVKAHGDLLEGRAAILRQEPEARFLFVGDGSLKHELIATASQLGVAHACLFTGARQDTFDLLAAMDVFVLPSLHEGVPMALLEAMTLGKPVVATAVGGVPEIVRDRVTGRLVAPRDDRELADACLEFVANGGLARRCGAAAQRAIAQGFSHDVSGEALLAVYRSMLEADSTTTRARTNGTDLSAAGLAWELTHGLLRIAGRRTGRLMNDRIARRRMNRIRHNPAPLRQALRAARKFWLSAAATSSEPFAAKLLARSVGPARCVSPRAASRPLPAIDPSDGPANRHLACDRSQPS